MKKWKRITALGLSAMMIASLTACGGSGDKKDDNTITVWCWDKTFNIFAMEEADKNLSRRSSRCEN
mgnify:CR=1 FL=1